MRFLLALISFVLFHDWCYAQSPPVVPGCFLPDVNQGTRAEGVGYNGNAQWLADINGDGRADYLYNDDGRSDYHVLVADGTSPYGSGKFSKDATAATRNHGNGVGFSGRAQWLADINGDGRSDLVYNRDDTPEYWVSLGQLTGTFTADQLAGSRNAQYEVGFSGRAQWMVDVNGDARADYVYNRDDTNDMQVMLADPSLQAQGTFLADTLGGSRNSKNAVGFGGDGQWFADVNGDGMADYVYNVDDTRDYWVMLATGNGLFATDRKAGTRAEGVGFSGQAQWFADVNGDGRADYVYNRAGSPDYWVMTGNYDGSFSTDALWGSRNAKDEVAYGAQGHGLADMNADGLDDLLYNKEDGNGSLEYYVMLSTGNGFAEPQFWGARAVGNGVGWKGRGASLMDVNGDGYPDLSYNKDGTREQWVLLSCYPPLLNPAQQITTMRYLDVWGEGFIRTSTLVTGFEGFFNLNKFSKRVSNGDNEDQAIPNLISVLDWDTPTFPIASNGVQVMTLMGAPITSAVGSEMYRTINKVSGVVILFGPSSADQQNFEAVFVQQHNWVNVTPFATLNYPYQQITMKPAIVYAPRKGGLILQLGRGPRVGGAGLAESPANQFPGGGTVDKEL